MKIKNYSYYQYLFILFILCLSLGKSNEVYAFQKDSLAQTTVDKELATELVETQEKKVEVYSAIREELHRYMGYEELLPRYVSLPYDVIMNTNISGAFVDIGYFLLLFLPVLLLFGIKNRLLKIGIVLLMLVFLIVSLPTGYRSHKLITTANQVEASITEELGQISFAGSPIIYVKLQLTQLVNTFYLPIHHHIIKVFSGEGDAITYPLLFMLFLIAFFLLKDRFKDSTLGIKAIPYFFLMYSFLWLLLGAGVIWYGLLIVPIGLVLIGIDALNPKKDTSFFKYAFLVVSTIWVASSLTYRFSNYSPPLTEKQIDAGITYSAQNVGAIHAAPLMYGLGRADKSSLLDFLFSGYSPVVKIINDDPEALVYRVGTFFQFFIERNSDRVLEDNQLAYFDNLYNLVPNKEKLATMLKRQRYKYLIIDFNVASIDRTPDETLTKKARRFQDFLEKNPNLELIGTDRIILNRQRPFLDL